jgi:L-2-hydroxycarboxylate dehydrogenase (NAD+)
VATYSYDQLYQFTCNTFKKIGCSDEHAAIATTGLLAADLRGIDSHGVARLSGYIRLWEVQRINAAPLLRSFMKRHLRR